jgi:hypothetical protein
VTGLGWPGDGPVGEARRHVDLEVGQIAGILHERIVAAGTDLEALEAVVRDPDLRGLCLAAVDRLDELELLELMLLAALWCDELGARHRL